MTFNMNWSLVFFVATVACGHVHADVPTSTPCSLSFYRYLFNLPGEQIRPNVPEGTYVFGKRVGPPVEDGGEASNVRPSILKPDPPKYEAPQYLPPALPSTTYLPPPPVSSTTYAPPPPPPTTTTTERPSTSAPLYIPPANPSYYPGSSNSISVKTLKPGCDDPKHSAAVPHGHLELPRLPEPSFNVPKYVAPQPKPALVIPKYVAPQPQPTFVVPKYVAPQPQPTFFVPKYVAPQPQPTFTVPKYVAPQPQPTFAVPKYVAPQTVRPFVSINEIPSFRYPVPTPPPNSFVYIKPTEHCEKSAPVTSTTTTTTTTTPAPEILETRQNDIVILPDALQRLDATVPDCGHRHHHVETPVAESVGVPSEQYGLSAEAPSAPVPSASAGYSYDKSSPSFGYPQVTGYTYPKPSPSFEYPASGYAGQATSLFESESAKSSVGGTEDGDLVILKV